MGISNKLQPSVQEDKNLNKKQSDSTSNNFNCTVKLNNITSSVQGKHILNQNTFNSGLNFDCSVTLEDISVQTVTVESLDSEQCRDNFHSATSDRQDDQKYLQDLMERQIIVWPALNDNEAWDEFNNEVHNLLNNSGSLATRLSLLENSIYDVAISKFGCFKAARESCKRVLDRRSKQIIDLVSKKNNLLSQLEIVSTECEYVSILALLNNVKIKLRRVRKVVNWKKRLNLRRSLNKSFATNPYKCGKNLLNPLCKTQLDISKEELDIFLTKNLSDSKCHDKLPSLVGLPDAPELKKKFVNKKLNDALFFKLLSSKRNSSAPGPNMIPYKVYKKCIYLSRFLLQLVKGFFNQGVIPIQWRIAKTHFIPKCVNPDPNNISDFRSISLMNSEGKIFWSMISKHIYQHVTLNNKILDTTIQKGSIERTPGCWEHMSMVWEGLKDARLRKQSISSVWLDISNAYGSIPHQLIFTALERYGIPEKWINLVKSYYRGLWSRSFMPKSPSSWHCHERGIFAGCTVSVVLFLLGMNLVIEYILAGNTRTYTLKTGRELPLVRAFMDDLNLMAPSVPSVEMLLQRTSVALTWARMSLNASKSRSFVIVKGRTMNVTPFHVSTSDVIPSIHSNPVKFLGRIIDASLTDRKSVNELEEKLKTGLITIDKSKFKGVQKLWIMQYLLIPKIRWSIMIYEISITRITILEAKISTYIRKWLGLHKNISNLSLYSKVSPCPLPISSLSSIFKCSKAGAFLQLRDSSDPFINNYPIQLHCGKFKIKNLVESAEQSLFFKSVSGHTQTNRVGLKTGKSVSIPPKNTKAYRKIVTNSIKDFIAEDDTASSVQLSVQGQWSNWKHYITNDLSWKCIFAMPPNLLSFCIGSTFDTLASPANLRRWGYCREATCTLCRLEYCTMAHILSGCTFSLRYGRYTYRHDSVLKILVNSIKLFLENKGPPIKSIPYKKYFVKEGASTPSSKGISKQGTLYCADDWEVLDDLDSNLVFPEDLVETSQRPDIVLVSKSLKHVIIIELTCPAESNMLDRHLGKIERYTGLQSSVELTGWKCDLFCIEVGARGFCSSSFISTFLKLGFPSKTIQHLKREVGMASLKASFWIWLARNDANWLPKKIDKIVNKVPRPKAQNSKQVVLNKPKVSSLSPPSGLPNLGNTCYLNSVIQSLSSLQQFWTTLSNSNATVNPLVKSFCLLCSQISKGFSNPVDPAFFISALKTYFSKNFQAFHLHQEQDAQEFLLYLFDAIFTILPDFKVKCSSSINSTTTCSVCSSSFESVQTFSTLPIPLCSSINGGIDSLICSEHLNEDNPWFCSTCDTYCIADRSYEISSLPQFFTIHVKRFSFSNNSVSKDNSKVDFYIDDFQLSSNDDDVQLKHNYNLAAFIIHSGSCTTGHYEAAVRRGNQWYLCNDRVVRQIQKEELRKLSPYILFYHLQP